MAYPIMEAALRRRDFITLMGCTAAAWPFPAQAQRTGRLARIGVLMGYAETDSEAKALLAEFTHALSEFGWTEGQNLRMDVRWAPAKTDLMRTFAKELVSLQPDLILTDSTPVTAAVKLLQQPPAAAWRCRLRHFALPHSPDRRYAGQKASPSRNS
jgi:hypothetical protein